MDSKLVFSIIIPTYNRAIKLKRCLNSLSRQTFKSFEVIVCDDGSNDNSEEVVAQFKGLFFPLKYFYFENWGGPAKPRNKGIAEAQGEWICFLDSDDYWYPHKLEVVNAYISTSDFIYHDFDTYNDKGKGRNLKARQLHKPYFLDLMKNGNTFITSSVCVKKELLVNANAFEEDQNLIAVEDFDLWLKLSRLDITMKHVSQRLGCYWNGGNNITTANEIYLQKLEYLYNKHLPYLQENDQQKALKIKAYLTAKVYHAQGCFKEAITYYKIALFASSNAIKLRSIFFLLKAITKTI